MTEENVETMDYPRIEPGTVNPKKSAPEPDVLAEYEDAGNIEVVRIDDLHRDTSYQREISQTLVDEIARSWDIAAAGPIVVSRRRNGDLYIVNGQHRTAAAKQAGETEIMAQVINGLDARREAILRLKGNTRRSDKSLERFRAQVAARNDESLQIVSVLEGFNTKINANPDQAHGINCVAAVEAIYRKDQGVLLARVLEIIKDSWGVPEGDNVSVSSLKGIAFLLDRHGPDELDRSRLIDRLSAIGPKGIEQRARAHKGAMGGAMWINWYRASIEVYNERLSQGKKLEWRTGKWSQDRLTGRDRGA